MSAQPKKKEGIGARIRALRGDESQEAFAKRVGLTRSALANYELERTRPKRAIIYRIASAAGVSPDAIDDGGEVDLDEALAFLGAKTSTDKMQDLTPDERALVRLLRACDEETVLEVVQAIISTIEEGRFLKPLLDVGTVSQDWALMKKIEADGGRYLKGFTRDTITGLLEALPTDTSSKDEQD